MASDRTSGGYGLPVLVGVLLFMVVALTGFLGVVVLKRTALSAERVREALEETARPVVQFAGSLRAGVFDAAVSTVDVTLAVPGASAGEHRRTVRRDLMVTLESETTPSRASVPASAPAVGGFTEGATGREETPRESVSEGEHPTPREWMRKLDSLRRHPMRKALGNPGAPLTLVVYLDLADPYSVRHLQVVLPALVRRFVRSDTVFYRVRHRPMDTLHPRAVAAANAAECAADQGTFWRFVVLAAADRDRLTEKRLIRIARRAGVRDLDVFHRCVRDRDKLARVKREGETARRLGVHSPPTVRIGDRLMPGPISVDQLERVVRRLTD